MTTNNTETEIEKLSDITDEMHECEGWEAYYDGGKYHDSGYESVVAADYVHDLADRIEAAVKREELKWAKANGELARMLDLEKAQGGNAAKLRQVLEGIKKFVEGGQCKIANDDARAILDNIEVAIVTPPRNCDVGTAEEQAERFELFCNQYRAGRKVCVDCPFAEDSAEECVMRWAQMPYRATQEKGGEE